jgi:hypothetical protein
MQCLLRIMLVLCGARCGLTADCCVRLRDWRTGFVCRRSAKQTSRLLTNRGRAVAGFSKRIRWRAWRGRSYVRRWRGKRAAERISEATIREGMMRSFRSTLFTKVMEPSLLNPGEVGQRDGCFVVADGTGPANHETIAQIARIAPMMASESVMGTSSQCDASILKATKASIAPRP